MFRIKNRFLLAIPKKGRLYEKSNELLKKAGFNYQRPHRSDIALCENLNSAVVFLPAKDIPYYVGNGEVDMGITGQDVIAEANTEVSEQLDLGFGKCRLCLLSPKGERENAEISFPARVVTSFPYLTENFFEKRYGKVPKVIHLSGSVETSCVLGLSDAVIDLVQTGETIEKAGLEIVEEIMKSEAVLISNPTSSHGDLIARTAQRISGILTAERYAMIEYNISKADLKKGEKITPGKRSPTVMPLENTEWVAVKALISKTDSNKLIEQLEKAGATDILVHHIQNCGAI